MSQNSNPIVQTADLLEQVKGYVADFLEDNPSVSLMVTSQLTVIINRLNGMTGRTLTSTEQTVHPPITDFLGDEITIPKKIVKEDLTPEQADREFYIKKVEDLYRHFGTIAPEGLLNSHTLPEDQLVIRGVAKRAGLEDYEDRAIDIEFLEDIAEAIAKKEAEQANEANIMKQIESGSITSLKIEEEEEEDEEDDDDEVIVLDPEAIAKKEAEQANIPPVPAAPIEPSKSTSTAKKNAKK